MASAPPAYSERLHAPGSWWLGGLGLTVSVWWVCFVATPLWVAAVAAVVTGALVASWLLSYGGASVRMERTGFRAGRALLPWPHVGRSVPLDAAETRRQLGSEADARAYLPVRPYCRAAIKVYVDDKADPTPYWIVSTRHPSELAQRLNQRVVPD